jgi:hypothetical protein
MPALPSAHQEYRKGRLAQHEMCDADPELVRAARECSEPGARTLYHHQGRAARDRHAIRRLRGLCIPGLPVEPPRPHLRPQPRPLSVSPEARPA